MQAVDRITLIFDYLSEHPDGSTILEISEKTELSQSVVHRFLSALKKHGYVVQDSDTKKYNFGLKIINLSMNMLNNNSVREKSRPFIEQLSKEANCFVFLCIYENDYVICIDTVQTNSNISFFVRIGSIMPVNSSASAQSIIAFLDEPEIERIMNNQEMVRFTNRTLVDTEKLYKKFDDIRESGYAKCDEELEQGVIGLSAPVLDYTRKVIGSVTVLNNKSDDFRLEDFVGKLKKAADGISATLGYIG